MIEIYPMDLLLNLLSKNAVGLCITDDAGICIELNQEFTHILGIERDSLINQPFANLALNNQAKPFEIFFDKLLQGNSSPIEFEFQNSDGAKKILSFCSEWSNFDPGKRNLYITVRKIEFAKQMQLHLQDREENQRADYFALINNMPDIVFSLDMNLNLVNFNRSFTKCCLEYFGEPPIVGDPIIHLLSGVEEEKINELVAKSRMGINFSFEDKLSNKGVSTDYYISINPILKESGQQIGISVFCQNITNRKSIEKENREKEILLNAMIQSMNDGVALANQLGELIICNEGLNRMIGIKDNRTMIADWQNQYQLFDPNTKLPILADEHPLRLALKGMQISNKEYMIKNPVRGEIHVMCSAMPILDQTRNVIAGMTVQHDISEIKEAVKNLQDSHERFEYVTQATFDAIWDLNLITDELYWGEGFYRLFGYLSQDNKGDIVVWYEHIHEDDRPRILNSINTLIKGKGSNWSEEYRFLKANGEIAYVRNKGVVVRDSRGKGLRMIGAMQDITQQRREGIEKEFIYELIQTINGNDFLELSLSIGIEKISNYFGFTYAEAWLVNIDDTKMLYKANWSMTERASKFRTNPPLELAVRGNGVMGKAWAEKKILYYEDIKNSEFICKENAELAGLNSVLLVPIFFNDRVIAMFNFFHDKPLDYEQISSDLLNRISKQLGSDIQKSRTDDELNRFFNLSPDLLCIIGFDGYFKKINQAVSKVLGFTETEMLRRDIGSFYSPGLEETLLGSKSEFEKAESTLNYENIIGTKTGEMKWLSWTAVPIVEEGVIFAIAKDITEKKQMELERENILESISDCFYALDNDFNFTYINAPAQILLRKSANELIGKNIFDVYPSFTEGVFYENFQKVLNEKTPIHFEIQFKYSSDWYEESFYPTSDGISIFFRSINERKKIEQEIKSAYEQKNIILESITDGFFTVDRQSRFTYFNKEAERILRISRDQVLEKSMYEIFPEAIGSKSQNAYNRALNENVAVHFEDFFEPLNTLFEISVYPSELGLSVYFKDITETKRLITLEQLEKEVLERNASPDGVLSETLNYYLTEIEKLHPGMTCSVLRLEGNKLYNWAGSNLNPTLAASINGVEIGDNVGSCGTAAYLKQNIIVSDISTDPRWVDYKKEALQAGYKACWSYPIINSLGAILGTFAVYYKDSRLPNKEEENNLLRALNILKVIIENKKFEEEILEMNERYDLVTKATNDIIWDWNIQADEVYRTGDGMLTLIDSANNQNVATNSFWQSRIHPDDLHPIQEKMNKFLNDANQFYWSATYRFRKPDNKYAHFFEKGYVTRNENREAIRMIGATRDITNQIETETLLKDLNNRLKIRAEELANSNVELERFAYIASHDLQEPLRMVTSFLQLLQKKYEAQLDATANKYIDLAVDGANRMKQLINDLLQFSRVTSSAIALKPVNTNEVLVELKELFKLKLQNCNGTLVIENLPIVNADKTPITQLLQNLISNALKYRSKERDPVVKISASETEQNWVFLVEDNGIGIESKFFEKIFVIFQRLHNKDEYSGTGIGLAICKKIVERFNGKIWVESELGKGSKFYFSIPK